MSPWFAVGALCGWVLAPFIYVYVFTYVRRICRWTWYGRCPYSQGDDRCLLADGHWLRGDPNHRWGS